MNWIKKVLYKPTYVYRGSNQAGESYKQGKEMMLVVVRLSANVDDAEDLKTLILFSDRLGVPAHYDFGTTPQTAWIELCSKEQVELL